MAVHCWHCGFGYYRAVGAGCPTVTHATLTRVMSPTLECKKKADLPDPESAEYCCTLWIGSSCKKRIVYMICLFSSVARFTS